MIFPLPNFYAHSAIARSSSGVNMPPAVTILPEKRSVPLLSRNPLPFTLATWSFVMPISLPSFLFADLSVSWRPQQHVLFPCAAIDVFLLIHYNHSCHKSSSSYQRNRACVNKMHEGLRGDIRHLRVSACGSRRACCRLPWRWPSWQRPAGRRQGSRRGQGRFLDPWAGLSGWGKNRKGGRADWQLRGCMAAVRRSRAPQPGSVGDFGLTSEAVNLGGAHPVWNCSLRGP